MTRFYRRSSGPFTLNASQGTTLRDLVRNFLPGIPANQIGEVLFARRPNGSGGVDVICWVQERVQPSSQPTTSDVPDGVALESE